MADLVVIDTHPFVPGHGPVGRRDALATVREYIRELERLAPEAEIPAAYSSWRMPDAFRRNLDFLSKATA